MEREITLSSFSVKNQRGNRPWGFYYKVYTNNTTR